MVEQLREAQGLISLPKHSAIPTATVRTQLSLQRAVLDGWAGSSAEEHPAERKVRTAVQPPFHFPTTQCGQAVPTQVGKGEFPVLLKGTSLSSCHVHRGGVFF